MPSTGPPSRGELGDRLHHRREARDRAGAQVVAVGEAAGDDDRVDALQVAVLVPEQLAPRRRAPRRAARRPRRRSPGNWRTPNVTASTVVERCDLVVLDQRVGEQLLAHLVELRRRPRPRARPAGRRGRARRPRSRAPAAPARPPALRVEDALLRADQDARAITRAVRSSQALERLAGDPLVGLDVLARACSATTSSGSSRRRAASCPSRSRRPSRARTACRRTAGRGPARSRRRARSARSRASAPRRRGRSRRRRRGRTRTSCRRG